MVSLSESPAFLALMSSSVTHTHAPFACLLPAYLEPKCHWYCPILSPSSTPCSHPARARSSYPTFLLTGPGAGIGWLDGHGMGRMDQTLLSASSHTRVQSRLPGAVHTLLLTCPCTLHSSIPSIRTSTASRDLAHSLLPSLLSHHTPGTLSPPNSVDARGVS
jgi:hypothetical protein